MLPKGLDTGAHSNLIANPCPNFKPESSSTLLRNSILQFYAHLIISHIMSVTSETHKIVINQLGVWRELSFQASRPHITRVYDPVFTLATHPIAGGDVTLRDSSTSRDTLQQAKLGNVQISRTIAFSTAKFLVSLVTITDQAIVLIIGMKI